MGDPSTKPRAYEEREVDSRWELVQRIVSSSSFQKAPRLRDLLTYIAEHSMRPDRDALSESQIARAVFGKTEGYTPLEDSTVRVHVRHLRLKLREYFEKEGRSETMTVEIPLGSHSAVFRDITADRIATGKNPLRLLPWILCGVLSLLCGFLGYRLLTTSRAGTAVQDGRPPWPLSRVIDDRHQTQIVVADVNLGVLQLYSGTQLGLDSYLRPGSLLRIIPQAANDREGRLVRYLSNSLFTSYADLSVTAAILREAGNLRDHITIRPARDVRLRDLEQGNFIFLGGAGPNPWVSLFRDQMNFRDVRGAEAELDKHFQNLRMRPGEQNQYRGLRGTGASGEDYATICLFKNDRSSGSVLILQGLQQEGTEAAGFLLTTEAERKKLTKALSLSPAGMDTLPFEALIRTSVTAGAIKKLEVVATRVSR